MSTPETPAGQEIPPPTRTSGRKWILGVAAVIAVVAVGVAAFAITRDDGTNNNGTGSQALDSQRIAATQEACRQWLDDYSSSTGVTPPQAWCND